MVKRGAFALVASLALSCSSATSSPAGGPANGAGADAGSVPDSGGAPVSYGGPLEGIGSLELVEGGFARVEGPVWSGGALYFSDIPNDRIERREATGSAAVFRGPSGHSNGLAIDGAGRLIACEMSNHRVTRTLADGTVAVVADQWQGAPFSSPNDVTVRKDGTIYFTDPGFDYPAPNGPPFHGIYRVDPSGKLSLESDKFDKPNGITLSIDEKSVFVSDTAGAAVRAMAVQADGSLGPPTPFLATAVIPDGMCIDDAGNLYVTTAKAVQVFGQDGALRGEIPVPEAPANCAFGGSDRRTLYITAQKSLYGLHMSIPGRPF